MLMVRWRGGTGRTVTLKGEGRRTATLKGEGRRTATFEGEGRSRTAQPERSHYSVVRRR
jgi:hypothetical protein